MDVILSQSWKKCFALSVKPRFFKDWNANLKYSGLIVVFVFSFRNIVNSYFRQWRLDLDLSVSLSTITKETKVVDWLSSLFFLSRIKFKLFKNWTYCHQVKISHWAYVNIKCDHQKVVEWLSSSVLVFYFFPWFFNDHTANKNLLTDCHLCSFFQWCQDLNVNPKWIFINERNNEDDIPLFSG